MSDLSSYINISANGISSGNINASGYASPAPSINGFDNIALTGNITAGGNIDIDGEGSIGGNLTIVGNIDFSGGGTINQITSPYGYFTGNTDGSNALYAGVPGGTIVPLAVAQFTSDANSYTQINSQNKNHGSQSSIEYVITGDLGTDTTDYLDIGFASSSWDGTQDNSLGTAVAARDGYLYVQGGGGGGNLVLGTTTSGTQIKFNVGGPNSANTVMTLSNTTLTVGNVNIMDKLDMTGNNITNIANASGNNANFAHFIGEGGNLSNIQVANISGLGNIATVNLDGNASNILYGNGSFAAAPSGGGYGDSNVVTLMGAFGSNTITTTGNISVGNIAVASVNATANITTTGYFISGNQATGGFKLGNVNSRIVVGGGNSMITLGTNPTITPDTAAQATAGVIIGGSGYMLATNGARVLTLGTDSSLAVTGNITQPNPGSGITTGKITRTGALSSTAWNASGIGIISNNAIFTDTSTAAGTQNVNYVHNLSGATLAFSNAVTVTTAVGLYVSAPTAGTNATFTNSYAFLAGGAISATGNITGANIITTGNVSGNTGGYALGYRDIPQVAASNTTLALTDAGKHYYSTTAGNLTLTIPLNSSVAFPTGTAISIVVQAAGNILVNAASGVTLYMAGNSTSANRVVGTYGMATLMKVATDTWFINGTGVS